MSLEVWFRQDIQRVLAGLASAGSVRGPEYFKALYDVAISFGVRIEMPPEHERVTVYERDDAVWRIIE